MRVILDDADTKAAAVKMGIASGGGILTAVTLNEWVALATLVYVVLQIGLLLPKYWRLLKKKK